MPAIIAFPTVVKDALAEFGDFFANAPERRHFAEYLTGLLVAARKNVASISGEFAQTTDQSCLNRWLTAAEWDAEALNERRLEWMQESPDTRYSQRGVIALDNVLIDHEGEMIEDVGWFWDHAEHRHKIAHDYLIANYDCPSGKHYPLWFRRFVKKDQCQQRGEPFVDHNAMFRDLVDQAVEGEVPGDFTFDSWFTNAANLNHIHAHERGYVGDLKTNRKIEFKGQSMKVDELAEQIKPKDRKKITTNDEQDQDNTQWYFTRTLRIPKVNHRVRIVILWANRNDSQPRKVLITNHTRWEVKRVLEVYRRRWSGTECFHRDGKQHLGMDDCQLRNGRGQTRHLYMVFLAYTVLMRAMHRRRPHAWALERLTTIGQSCRAVGAQTLSQTLEWVVERVQEQGWNMPRIKEQLALP